MKNIFLFLLIVSTFHINSVAQSKQDSIPSLNKKKLLLTELSTTGVYGITMAGLWHVWYSKEPLQKFHIVNDNQHWMQMDKFGHAFSNYMSAKAFSDIYMSTGMSKKKSMILGGAKAWVMVAMIDVLDGFSAHWGFSPGDLLANTSGIALYSLQGAFLEEQLIYYKWSYRDVGYADYNPAKLGEDMSSRWLHDYNGQTYWFSLNLGAIEQLKTPKWLSVAYGIGANGMLLEVEEPTGIFRGNNVDHIKRYRQHYVGLDINWQNIPTNNKALKSLFYVLNFVRLPLPALEFNRGNGMKGYLF